MKKIKSVIAPEGVFEDITAGKEYPIRDMFNKEMGYIKDDVGDEILIAFKKCEFLYGWNWIVRYEDEPKTKKEYRIIYPHGKEETLTFPFDTDIRFADGMNYNTHDIYHERAYFADGIWRQSKVAVFPWQVSIIVIDKKND